MKIPKKKQKRILINWLSIMSKILRLKIVNIIKANCIGQYFNSIEFENGWSVTCFDLYYKFFKILKKMKIITKLFTREILLLIQ